MRYYLDKQLLPEAEATSPEHKAYSEHKPYVELLSFAEIQERRDPLEVPNATSIRRCKAEIYEEEVVATIHIPDFSDEDKSKWSCLFYLEKNSLILVGNVALLETELQKLGSLNRNIRTPGQLLFALLEDFIRNDEDLLDETDNQLDAMDDQMVKDAMEDDFEVRLLEYRKLISRLNRYYQQLLEMLSALASCPFSFLDKESKRMFRYLYNKVDIYYIKSQKLKEQLDSLFDHYQMMHNEHQEEAVRFLTIATSIFMPLTLLTGWYGMNFTHMPELYWKYGYIVVIAVAILILLLELILFKKKKWL